MADSMSFEEAVGGQGQGPPNSMSFEDATGAAPNSLAQNVTPESTGPTPWADVGKGFVENMPSDLMTVGKEAISALNPINLPTTLKNIGEIGEGIPAALDTGARDAASWTLRQAGLNKSADALDATVEPLPQSQATQATIDMYKQRYGSEEAIKQSLMNTPAQTLMDASIPFTGGEALAARLPEAAGAAKVLGTVGRTLDPYNATVQTGKTIGKGIGTFGSQWIGNAELGTGTQSVKEAAGAGYQGGDVARDFWRHFSGVAPKDEVIDDSLKALNNIQQKASAAYQQGMMGTRATTDVLPFQPIDEALAKIGNRDTFNGRNLSTSTNATRQKIGNLVDQWRDLDPAQFHTAAGLDAMKRELWNNIASRTDIGTPDRDIAMNMYHTIKDQIASVSPEYAKTMQDYADAQQQLGDLKRTLSLNPNATKDSTLRKLQSILRNNVNTDFENRMELGKVLEANGAPNLMAKLAGQALNTWTPRGLMRMAMSGANLPLALLHPGFALRLPFEMPKLVGLGLYGAGRASRPVADAINNIHAALDKAGLIHRVVAQGAFQTGRMNDWLSQYTNSLPTD